MVNYFPIGIRIGVSAVSSNLSLYITNDKTDPVLDQYIINVSNDSRKINSLHDNPYGYDKLKSVDFKYAVMWLDKGNPIMGFFICQYPELGANVARIYVRYYKIGRPLTRKFMRYEHFKYNQHLKPLFVQDGIDTLFFTRHITEKTSKEVKWRTSYQYIMSGGINIQYHEKVRFKGFDQIVYYYNAYQSKPADPSFIEHMSRVK